jgi:hypothetical protein
MGHRLNVGDIVTLNQEAYSDGFKKPFRHGGGELLTRKLNEHAKNFNIPFYGPTKIKALIKSRSDRNSVIVKFIEPFSIGIGCLDLPGVESFTMDDLEFVEYNSLTPTEDFIAGEWVYYMGGTDTCYWKPGMVGQISEVAHDCYKFTTQTGDMKMGGSNSKIHFRRATLDEINRAQREVITRKAVEYYTDSHGNIFERPSQIFGNPCAEIKLDMPSVYTLSMFPNSADLSNPSTSEQDETKISFKSTKLVANKINNSKEVENFLLTN